MDIGINLATTADSWKIVKRAEELGYTRVWFYDTHMLNADVFAAMAAAAMVTSKIRLGTGVLIPSNRIAPVAANALATINALAPGRVDFGVSTGSTARSTMGLGPVKLADMTEYIRIVQSLLQLWQHCGVEISVVQLPTKQRNQFTPLVSQRQHLHQQPLAIH